MASIVRVWPLGPYPVPKQGGLGTFSPAGEDVEETSYVLRRIDQGELTKDDPDLDPPYIEPIHVEGVRIGYLSSELSYLSGLYLNAVLTTIGQATASDGLGKTFRWDPEATDAEVVGSVYGRGVKGRWFQAGTVTGEGGGGTGNPAPLQLTMSASGTLTNAGIAQAGSIAIEATSPGVHLRGIRRFAGGVANKTLFLRGTNDVIVENEDGEAEPEFANVGYDAPVPVIPTPF